MAAALSAHKRDGATGGEATGLTAHKCTARISVSAGGSARQCNALLDTGATRTFLSWRLYKEMRTAGHLARPMDKSEAGLVVVGDGNSCHSLGSVELDLTFSDGKASASARSAACVMRAMPYDVVVGVDVMKKLNFQFNFNLHLIAATVAGRVRLQLGAGREWAMPAQMVLHASERVVIPPRSAMLVPVQPQRPCACVAMVNN